MSKRIIELSLCYCLGLASALILWLFVYSVDKAVISEHQLFGVENTIDEFSFLSVQEESVSMAKQALDSCQFLLETQYENTNLVEIELASEDGEQLIGKTTLVDLVENAQIKLIEDKQNIIDMFYQQFADIEASDLQAMNNALDALSEIEALTLPNEVATKLLMAISLNEGAELGDKFQALQSMHGAIDSEHLPELETLLTNQAFENKLLAWEALSLINESNDITAKDELLFTMRQSNYYPDYINNAIDNIIKHNERGENYNLSTLEHFQALGGIK